MISLSNSRHEDLNILLLDQTCKQALIDNLFRYSTILLDSTSISTDTHRMLKENNSILQMINALKSTNTDKPPTKRLRMDLEGQSQASQTENFEISHENRVVLINYLMNLKDYTYFRSSTLVPDEKFMDSSSWIGETKWLISVLSDLPLASLYHLNESHSYSLIKEKVKASSKASSKASDCGHQSTDEDIIEIDKDSLPNSDQTVRKVSTVKSNTREKDKSTSFVTVECLYEAIRNLRNEVNLYRREAKFKFGIDSVENFFKSNCERLSKFFYCDSIPFSLSIKHSKHRDKATQSLEFYLRCEHKNDSIEDCVKWICQCDFDLKLISQIDKGINKVKNASHTFRSSGELIGFGFESFIDYDEMMSSKNVYVKDDVAIFAVYLRVKKFMRYC